MYLRMPRQPIRGPNGPSTVFSKHLIIPLAGCIFALILHPLILTACETLDQRCLGESRIENKLFWPIAAAIALLMIWRDRSRLIFPPHIIWLFCNLAFAGTSILWAFKPEFASIRFAQEAMIVTSIVLPVLVADRDADVVRGLFFCFTLATILNLLYLLGPPAILPKNATPGYTGYFPGKNYMGECAGVALILSLYEITKKRDRRAWGAVTAVISVVLLVLSNSRTALALAILAPALAGVAVFLRKRMRISPLAIPVAIIAAYAVASIVFNIGIYRLSYMMYGESTFTGRKFIWDFANMEIARRPLLGWGYQAFWLVGADSPSVTDAPGWIKAMPNAHNGYLDTMLELGYAGFVLLIAFLGTTLHASGRLLDREAVRGWVVLSLAFFVVMSNGLESTWMRAFEFLWVVFLIITAEIARYCSRASEWPQRAAGPAPALIRRSGSPGFRQRLPQRPARGLAKSVR
jgi:exopolysaccharide production protein ExoQ